MSEPLGQLELLTLAVNRLADAYEKSTGQNLSDGASTPHVTVTQLADESGTATSTPSKKTTPKKNTPAKKADESAKAGRTKQETLDAVVAYKDATDAPSARALLSRHGFVKLVDVTEGHDALYDEAIALLGALPESDVQDEEI